MKQLFVEESDAQGIADLNLIGPAPAFIPRVRGKYRWQLILRGSNLSAFLSQIPFTRNWVVDIDPVSMT